MKSKSTVVLLVLAFFVLGAAIPGLLIWNPLHWDWADHVIGRGHAGQGGNAETATKQLWTCGMHPQVIQDEPGNCPICGMKLVPLKKESALAAPAATETNSGSKERKIKYWRAPMDPNFISDKPGKSPMGMDLVPVYEDEAPTTSGVRVDPAFLQNFAVRTAVVKEGSIPVDIRTIGVLTYNERDIASVNTKFAGWMEKVYVNYIGEPVKKGQLLFEIYSPQLVTTQQEFLAAVGYVNKLEGKASADAVERARSLLKAARERLRYWDITEEQIDELRRSGKITRTVKFYSPVSGIVVRKMDRALEGMRLNPGMNVFKIADLSTIWAEIEVYEYHLQYVRLGQTARITVDAFPGRHWTGKIIYLDPSLDQKTRTLKVSVEIPNPGFKLRPEMYANIELQTPAVRGVVKAPEEAILHTGERSVIIVQKEKGVFEPRDVKLGAMGGGYQEVRSGLRAGEVIVTSSQFLIDSESNLKEAINKMLATRAAAADKKAATEAAPQK